MEPPDRLIHSYGRRRGRALRAGRASLIDEMLPRLTITVPAPVAALDPATLFARRPGAVWLEIGFGGGEHLRAQAEANRDVGLIGCEIWNVLVWFATLVALADGLNRVGFVGCVARGFAAKLSGIPPLATMALLVAFFFYVHYMFASLTAHTAAVLPVVLATGMAVPGLPVDVFALLLVYSLGLMGVLSPYATGPAPVYYGSGYVSRRAFWTRGLVFGAIYLAVLLGVGIPYLTAVNPPE